MHDYYYFFFNFYCTCPSPATLQCKSGASLTFIWCTLIHFSSSTIHFKVGCRQSKFNRLFNLFSPCLYTLSSEITEQQPRKYRDFENIQRAHLPAERTPHHSSPYIYAVCCCVCAHVPKCMNLCLCVGVCFVQEVLPAHTHTRAQARTHTHTHTRTHTQLVILDLVEQCITD